MTESSSRLIPRQPGFAREGLADGRPAVGTRPSAQGGAELSVAVPACTRALLAGGLAVAGTNPGPERQVPAVRNRVLSPPVAAMMTSAVDRRTPGMVTSRSSWRANGRISTSIHWESSWVEADNSSFGVPAQPHVGLRLGLLAPKGPTSPRATIHPVFILRGAGETCSTDPLPPEPWRHYEHGRPQLRPR